jgi:cardiolipin synthase
MRGDLPVRGRHSLRRVAAALAGLLASSCATLQPSLVPPNMAAESRAFRPTLEAYTDAPARSGNRVDLLLNGEEIFPAQLRAIRAARRTITYAQYVYEDGPPARRIAEAIADRCRAGVKAHVLLDGFGSIQMPPEYRATLEDAGCQVAVFHPLNPLAVDKVNFRNHRRILVVDGRLGFTGASGASSRWMGDGRQVGHWRQTDVRVEGPVVNDLQAAFVENWLEATGRMLGGEGYFAPQPDAGSVTAQVVRSSPDVVPSSVYAMFLLMISSARHSIYITNPYFVPDAQIVRLMLAARRRGVRIALLLPGVIDNELVRKASRAGFGQLLDAGIEIYEYRSGLLHAKSMTVDGVWGTVGSANLDRRSAALNDEVNLIVYDQRLVRRLDRIFFDDLAHAQRVDDERWRARSFWERFVGFLALPLRNEL